MEEALQNTNKQTLLRRLKLRYQARLHLRRRISWIGYSLATLNLILLAFLVFDTPLGLSAKELPKRLVTIAGDVTDIGRLTVIFAVTATVLLAGILIGRRLSGVRRRYRMAILAQIAAYLSLSLISASLVAHVLKFAIGRARPMRYDSEGIFGLHPFANDFFYESFPSGHSTHVGAVFAALAFLFPRFRILFLSLGLWLGATRIIIGVHYPSDVVAGLALGAWFAFATAILFARFGVIFNVSPGGWPLPRFLGLSFGGRKK